MRFRDLRIEASPLARDQGLLTPDLVFRWTAHHVREIFSALLPKGYVLDGSSVVQITFGPRGDQPQYQQCLGSSEYYAEDFDFGAYASSTSATRERILLASVELALCEIAKRAGADAGGVRHAAAGVIDCGFRLSVEIATLRKALRQAAGKVHVFRCLSADIGETWLARVCRRDGQLIAEAVMGDSPSYLDRREYFKTAELIGSTYVVYDRLQRETFRLDLTEYEKA